MDFCTPEMYKLNDSGGSKLPEQLRKIDLRNASMTAIIFLFFSFFPGKCYSNLLIAELIDQYLVKSSISKFVRAKMLNALHC